MRPIQASLQPSRGSYRNKLRGLSEEELKRRLMGQRESPRTPKPNRQDTLRRRLALTQNPGIRQEMPDRIEKIRGLVNREERAPEEQQRLELLRARRDSQLFGRPQASVRPNPLQLPPDVAPTAPPDQQPTLTAEVGKLPKRPRDTTIGAESDPAQLRERLRRMKRRPVRQGSRTRFQGPPGTLRRQPRPQPFRGGY